MRRIEVEVNGEVVSREVEPRLLLSDFLRHELELTGTHVGCEQGGCGVCTIQVDGRPVRSCLMFAVQVDGHAVRTVEGLSDGVPAGELHVLQQAFQDAHGLQCGFCTPGFLMSLEPLLVRETPVGEHEIREALGGTLCRCTGYQGIVDAVQLAIDRTRPAGDEETDR